MRTWRGAAVLCVALAQVAAAEDPGGLEGLAPPGPCAEESTLRGEPEGLEPQAFDPEGFDVAGGPREHFDAVDVAAPGDGGAGFQPPAAPIVQRGPCEGPAARCADVFERREGGVVITEPDPGTGDGPPFGGPR